MFPLPFLFFIRAFFASILEPLFYGRKVLWYEVFFGLIIIAGLGMIMQVEVNYLNGMLYALVSIILGVLFTLERKINSKSRCNRYLLLSLLRGCFISLYFLYQNKFTADFFVLSFNNWALMLILASICTAYAFGFRESDEKLSPYTVMLTTNLEGLRNYFSVFYYWWKEKMSFSFTLEP
jgi:hypothetical protein